MSASWSGDPKTWTNGEITEAEMNAEVRDRFDWVKTLLALHGMDSASVLGQLVGARYAVKVSRSSQTIPDATDQLVYWDTEEYDDDGLWTGSQPARITIKVDSHYAIKAWGKYEADNGGAMRGLEIYIDGSSYSEGRVPHCGGSFQTTVRSEDELYLTAGTEVYVRARHNAGHAIDLNEATLIVRRLAKTP